jgi:hypothetical protein
MKLDKQVIEEVLGSKPNCFAIPHEFNRIPCDCDACHARQECLATSAQLFLADRVGLLNGKVTSKMRYAANDARQIVPLILENARNPSATRPCKTGVLPRLFERAMHAYADRPPCPSVDQLMDTLDLVTAVAHEREPGAFSQATDGDTSQEAPNATGSAAVGNPPPFSDRLYRSAQVDDDVNRSLEEISHDGCEDKLTDLPAGDEGRNPADMFVEEVTEEATPSSITSAASDGTDGGTVYAFAGASRVDHYRTIDDATLLDQLRTIFNRVRKDIESYHNERGDWCAIHTVMNERQLRPPRFRPYIAFPKNWRVAGSSRAQQWSALDRQIIDLHWLHASGYRHEMRDAGFANLLNCDTFSFVLARQFVQQPWSKKSRIVNILGLPDELQWPLSTYALDSVSARIKELGDESGRVTTRLKSLAIRRPKLLPNVDDYGMLWFADQLCGGKDQRLIARVYGWKKGEKPLAASTLSQKLRQMRDLGKP